MSKRGSIVPVVNGFDVVTKVFPLRYDDVTLQCIGDETLAALDDLDEGDVVQPDVVDAEDLGGVLLLDLLEGVNERRQPRVVPEDAHGLQRGDQLAGVGLAVLIILLAAPEQLPLKEIIPE